MTDAIRAEGLVKRFKNTTALAGVDLVARSGAVLGVLGPNGSGKTTTVRVLATLLRPDEGRALVGGHDVVAEPHLVRRQIGLTGQYAAVDQDLTGTQNLMLIARLLGFSRRDARARAAELLERFSLTDAGERPARTYSGGMRRRLDLAASLVGRPSLLFLDEPTTGLDPHSRNELWGVVRGLVGDGVTVLLTTQYLEEADQLADDIAVIDHGRVISTGTPEELKARAGDQVLEMRPTDTGRLADAAGIVTAVTGTTAHTAGDSIRASVADPAALPAVVRRLDDAGVAVAELTLRRPSLDEVFLALTGHPAEPADTTDTAATTDPAGTRQELQERTNA
ncbi:ATP-binding cassette domain-containing protein [Marinitenerispora sediminis]|uniref:Daunorubicin/doxorubicin resistance ABC transporter ATP-binding protein DrrA n=1 Tax=Marinitenerispora sediminis TaxID=1931232 RepID=A0A368T262_9ACTN|nr:ATP-binding cassette domain-containing protein [Marinitenerispora sediminis]RCV48938.1 daunorubicin/doxorubicin resistance ABC transporter ATP-binding protein DrrA [Marinitenerispora sediminis]RCV49687.1 daunorubicin/doxorubicin resistance ABC transporter ATP-binding protein DrrA [Marinitenerispora sediminis]RCV58633.1 daunorubicin/doxorubicin resistance ABC transporter ATP-binding protein DrrA [Marinitenerispora sediminis]